VVVGADWAARHLDHGYAMTCHKAQGVTVDVALLYGTAALTREAGYVALSRGRSANHLYVPDQTDQPGAAGSEDGYLDGLAARLSQRRRHALATRQLPRTHPGAWAHATTADPAQHRAEGISR
jgi:ATP-dependent exoDNAse (exonuclease V) alpha subunit